MSNPNTLSTVDAIRNLLTDTVGTFDTINTGHGVAFIVDGQPVPMDSIESAEQFIVDYEVGQFVEGIDISDDYFMVA